MINLGPTRLTPQFKLNYHKKRKNKKKKHISGPTIPWQEAKDDYDPTDWDNYSEDDEYFAPKPEVLPTAGVKWILPLQSPIIHTISIMYNVEIVQSYSETYFASWFPRGYIGLHEIGGPLIPNHIIFSLFDVNLNQCELNPKMNAYKKLFYTEPELPDPDEKEEQQSVAGVKAYIDHRGIQGEQFTFRVDYDIKNGTITGSYINNSNAWHVNDFTSRTWKDRWIARYKVTEEWMKKNTKFNRFKIANFVQSSSTKGLYSPRIALYKYIKMRVDTTDNRRIGPFLPTGLSGYLMEGHLEPESGRLQRFYRLRQPASLETWIRIGAIDAACSGDEELYEFIKGIIPDISTITPLTPLTPMEEEKDNDNDVSDTSDETKEELDEIVDEVVSQVMDENGDKNENGNEEVNDDMTREYIPEDDVDQDMEERMRNIEECKRLLMFYMCNK